MTESVRRRRVRELEFADWLSRRMAPQSVTSRVSNCRRVEEFEGDLDSAYRKDGLLSLMERLTYSRADQDAAGPARHHVPIAGNVYDGTATLRSAVNLYKDFCSGIRQVTPRAAHLPSLRDEDTVPIAEDKVHGPFSETTTPELLKVFCDLMDELRTRKIMRTANNPVADYAEFLVARALNLTLVGNSTAGHDAVAADGRRFEIKARRMPRGSTSIQLSAIRGLDECKFDVLAAVLFSSRFEIERACLIPFEVVKTHAKYVSHVNAWNLILRPSLWMADSVEDFTSVLRQASKV
jgi:hypothetical protein